MILPSKQPPEEPFVRVPPGIPNPNVFLPLKQHKTIQDLSPSFSSFPHPQLSWNPLLAGSDESAMVIVRAYNPLTLFYQTLKT